MGVGSCLALLLFLEFHDCSHLIHMLIMVKCVARTVLPEESINRDPCR